MDKLILNIFSYQIKYFEFCFKFFDESNHTKQTSRKKNKLVTEEDQLKKIEKEEKRREYM